MDENGQATHHENKSAKTSVIPGISPIIPIGGNLEGGGDVVVGTLEVTSKQEYSESELLKTDALAHHGGKSGAVAGEKPFSSHYAGDNIPDSSLHKVQLLKQTAINQNQKRASGSVENFPTGSTTNHHLKKSKFEVSQDGQIESSAQSSSVNLIITRSKKLINRWHRLELGKTCGTVALNEYISRHVSAKKEGTNITAAQMVQMFENLHPIMEQLPPNSPVFKFMRKAEICDGHTFQASSQNHVAENQGKAGASDVEYISPLPTEKLATAYGLMAAQPNHIMVKRRKIHHLDGDQVIQRLKSYENRICELKIKENQAMAIFMECCTPGRLWQE